MMSTVEKTAYTPTVCTVCGCAPIDANLTGYCEACEETISEDIDIAFESLMPLVVFDGKASEIARVLWQSNWRVLQRSAPNAPRCRGCGGWCDAGAALLELQQASNLITNARARDEASARAGVKRNLPAELKHWIGLCGRVFRHMFAALVLLQSCAECTKKAQENASKIIRPS